MKGPKLKLDPQQIESGAFLGFKPTKQLLQLRSSNEEMHQINTELAIRASNKEANSPNISNFAKTNPKLALERFSG